MAVRTLSGEEITKRLIRLRNLERLHREQKLRNEQLVVENKQLNRRVTALEKENAVLKSTMEDLKLQIEELRTIVFGRKRKKEENNDHTDIPPIQMNTSPPRTKESYKRRMPQEDEITETKDHAIDVCARCNGQFAERDAIIYGEEDIPLPHKKHIIKHIVEKGYCDSCRIGSASVLPPTADVVLGDNVKRYVIYLSVICRQSYGQIQDILKQSYDFEISQGEIAKILEREGERLRPEYERLKAKIRGEPSVPVDQNPHQLCCAHILRKLRDLATSSEITGEVHNHCVAAYTTFAEIYAAIETARISFDPKSSYDELTKRLQQFVSAHPHDPAKLTRIKEQVAPRITQYLTCLLHPHVASDNNAAERSLRHLVLKRKISFGSLSEKTAETLAILCSVLLSHKQRGTLREYLMGV